MSEAVCACGCPWRMHDTDTMIAPCRQCWCFEFKRDTRRGKNMNDDWQNTEDQGAFLGTASFVSTTSNRTNVYPCDMGLGQPSGYHHFEASTNGIVVCRYCGKKPS